MCGLVDYGGGLLPWQLGDERTLTEVQVFEGEVKMVSHNQILTS